MISVLGGKKGDRGDREVYLSPFRNPKLLNCARTDIKINLIKRKVGFIKISGQGQQTGK